MFSSFINSLVSKNDVKNDVDAFLEEIIPTGMQNISRTGSAAISRGKDKI